MLCSGGSSFYSYFELSTSALFERKDAMHFEGKNKESWFEMGKVAVPSVLALDMRQRQAHPGRWKAQDQHSTTA